MGLRTLLGVAVVLVAFAGCGNDDAQKVQPESRGKRGEACQARNDCESGLACLNQICSRNDFDVEVSPKQCDLVECSSDRDCCGDKPSSAPAACARRAAVCDSSTVPGCQPASCTSNAACNGGTCRPGTCTLVGGTCNNDSDCADTCALNGFCSISTFTVCATDAQCTGSCVNRSCNCTNPEYNPADPICTDPACADVCLLRCDDNERCVTDTSCEVASDCFDSGLTQCDAGRCVQCAEDEDCNTEANETCQAGQCQKPCEKNEECGLFEACEAGECAYVGCSTDRECILAASRDLETANEDARLLKCLPSETDPDISTCKVPCENDGSCGQFQVCDAGYCKFVGCDTNEECRAYLGLKDQMTTPARPFIATAVCRE